MRRSPVLLVALGLLVFAAAPAFAQYPPDEDAELVVSDTTVVPGQPMTVAGADWQPGSEVTITFESEPVVLGTASVGDDGTFSTTVTIPEDATAGEHTIRVTGIGEDGEPQTQSIAITVVAAAAAVAGGLAATGGTVTVGLALAVGLFALGGAGLYATRKKVGADS